MREREKKVWLVVVEEQEEDQETDCHQHAP